MGAKSLNDEAGMAFYPKAELAAMRLEYRPRCQDETPKLEITLRCPERKVVVHSKKKP